MESKICGVCAVVAVLLLAATLMFQANATAKEAIASPSGSMCWKAIGTGMNGTGISQPMPSPGDAIDSLSSHPNGPFYSYTLQAAECP